MRGRPVCDRCAELRLRIVRYSEHSQTALDPLTIERISKLVGDYEQELLALNCQPKK
jgi:hypothetical protein